MNFHFTISGIDNDRINIVWADEEDRSYWIIHEVRSNYAVM